MLEQAVLEGAREKVLAWAANKPDIDHAMVSEPEHPSVANTLNVTLQPSVRYHDRAWVLTRVCHLQHFDDPEYLEMWLERLVQQAYITFQIAIRQGAI